MPVTIMMMGIVFNVLNGMMQAGGLFYFASEGMYSGGWTYLLKTHAWSGLLLFFAGMLITLHSDHVIRVSRATRIITFLRKVFIAMSLLPTISVNW